MRNGDVGYLLIKNIPPSKWSVAIGITLQRVGRSPEANVRIPDNFPAVSRLHFEVWGDRRGLWIRDLGSRSGTKVNGVWVDHVPQAGIVPGDTIHLPGLELEVVVRIDELAEFVSEKSDDCPTSMPDRPNIMMARSRGHLLSPAEIDVLLWLSRGFHDDREIGRLLHRSPNTVRTEIDSMYRKLGLHSRAELMGWLMRSHYAEAAQISLRPPERPMPSLRRARAI